MNDLGKGIHFHVGGFAIMDILFTVLGAVYLSYKFKWSFVLTLLGLFLLGIILHRLFKVRTTVDRMLFKE